MARRADLRYQAGDLDYTIAWILLTFLGIFGIHRFYMGKWVTGIIYLLTGGLVGLGLLYDLWTLNGQVSEINRGGFSDTEGDGICKNVQSASRITVMR